MSFEINLLQNQKDYNKLENIFRIARISVIIFGAVCMIILLVVFALKNVTQRSVAEASERRNKLLAEINTLQESEAEVVLVQEKLRGINEIRDATPDYATHIEKLLTFIPQSSDSAQLQSLLVDTTKASLVITFNSSLPLTSFLGTLESQEFQEAFSFVELGALSVEDGGRQLLLNLDVGFKEAKKN